jgi:hypothetical protein
MEDGRWKLGLNVDHYRLSSILYSQFSLLAATQPDYGALITRSILRDYASMLHEPSPPLAFAFITPGSVYRTQLWGWDSWLSDVALCQIMNSGDCGGRGRRTGAGHESDSYLHSLKARIKPAKLYSPI